MLKQITLAAIFALGLSTAIAAQTTKTTETDRALARLGDLAPDAVRRRLNEMRPPAYQPGPVLLNEIIKRQELTVITGERVERLKESLHPVLAYHKRDGKLPIYVLRSEQPKAFVSCRAALIITTKLMLITSEAELRGIVAHELAHEYLLGGTRAGLRKEERKPAPRDRTVLRCGGRDYAERDWRRPSRLCAGVGADDLHWH